MDTFVDEMLYDTVRRWMQQRDFEPAYWRNECGEPWVRTGRISACQRYAAAVGQNAPGAILGRLRGRCREQQFIRNLCLGRVASDARGRLQRVPARSRSTVVSPGADIRSQIRVQPGWRRSPVVDAVPGTPGGPGYEHKSVYLPRYVNATTGQIDRRALRALVTRHAHQVHRQQNWARLPGHRAGLPGTYELAYSLEGLRNLPPGMQRSIRDIVTQAAVRTGIRAHVLRFSPAAP